MISKRNVKLCSMRCCVYLCLFFFFFKKCIINKNIRWSFLLACEQALAAFRRRGGKKKESLQLTYNSLEFEYLHRKSRCEMLIGRDDISNDVITLGTCFSIFVYIRVRFRFALIGGNLTAQSTGATGNWRWNSNFRGVVEGSPTFSCPAARAPGELARKLLFCDIQKNRLHSHLL